MIRALGIGISKALFGAAILIGLVAFGFGYLAYKVLRWVVAGDKPMPVRAAAFGLLTAGVVLGKAMQAEQVKRAGAVAPDPTYDEGEGI